jgi:hypothetical protein
MRILNSHFVRTTQVPSSDNVRIYILEGARFESSLSHWLSWQIFMSSRPTSSESRDGVVKPFILSPFHAEVISYRSRLSNSWSW